MKYNVEHIWARIDERGMVVVGISEHAQEQLGDIVYVELPSVGREVVLEEEIVIIESVKATSEINAPVAGTVFEVNEALEDHPELINESSLDAGWLICIESNDTAIMDAMMDEDAYQEFVDAEM
ncbi:MAG: glycine cleavage system protein GcvH [Proteobacteria bacterium]|nr:MAG: glycine cleavage system protein GcvH [Pseudomonadota bacterium]